MTTPKYRLPALATLALLASACAPLVQHPEAQAPLPSQWPAQEATAATAAQLPDWRAFFADPALQQLIPLALAHNRDLRVATLGIEQARAQYQIREADRLPTLNAVANGSRTPTSAGRIASSYTAGLSLTAFELDFFGRVARLQDQALAQYLASREARDSAQISLAATVASLWLNLVADEQALALTRQTLASREASLALIRLRYDRGAASEPDLRQAQSLVEATRASLAQQQRQRALDENALQLLLGQPVPPALLQGLAHTRLDQLALPDVPAGLPSQLLARRPDIRQAEQQVAAARANVEVARAAFFPRITLTAGAGSASSHLSDLLQGGSWGFTLAPSLSLPVLDGGRNQAGLESAQAGQQIALAQYEKAVLTAFREVADALASRQTLQDQYTAQRAQVEADRARLRAAEQRFEHGLSSALELQDAQRNLLATQLAELQTQLASQQNRVALFKALGGGLVH